MKDGTEVKTIQRLVAEQYGFTIKELWSSRKTDGRAKARMITCYICMESVPDLSYNQLGKILGRDHTTVMYAHKTIKRQIGEDMNIADMVANLIAELDESMPSTPICRSIDLAAISLFNFHNDNLKFLEENRAI